MVACELVGLSLLSSCLRVDAQTSLARLCLSWSGSSSIKVALYEFRAGDAELRRIHSESLHQKEDAAKTLARYVDEHTDARQAALEAAAAAAPASSKSPPPPIRLIVHRVVHGGPLFHNPTVIDEAMLTQLETLNSLAPLHNPPAISWIKAAEKAFPSAATDGEEVTQIAIFDTSFFDKLPLVSQTYAIHADLVKKHHLRRYGFHGIAHEAMWTEMCEKSAKKEQQGGKLSQTRRHRSEWDARGWTRDRVLTLELSLSLFCRLFGSSVSLQLGSGCSAAALLNGAPQDTSMGFTPLEGLVMSTRCGSIDPALLTYLMAKEPSVDTPAKMEDHMYHQSGLFGLSAGESNDMKQLSESSSPAARLAVDVFLHAVTKQVGAYIAVLGGLDTLVFGGGIGEHSKSVRQRIVAQLGGFLPIALDDALNSGGGSGSRKISSADSKIEVWVVEVDEAAIMVRDALQVMQNEKA